MKTIKSVTNPEIKATAKLSNAKERNRQKRFIVEGRRAVMMFLHAGWAPEHVYTTKLLSPEIKNSIKDELITKVTDHVMAKISQAQTPSGLCATFAIPKSPSPDLLTSGLVLADISNPGNMGTLIRTAVALGKRTVVVIGGTNPWSPKVVQASAGTISQVDLFFWSWPELMQHKKHYRLSALVVKGGTTHNKENNDNKLLIIGNEAHGLPHEWIEQCDEKITIPMPGKAESLNAAVAGSIAAYLVWQ